MNRNVHRQIAEERGVDIRNPSSALFGVSSGDRYKDANQKIPYPTRPYNFTLSSAQYFMYGFFTRIALPEIKFTWAIPTLTTKNNQIAFTYNGVTTTVTVPAGWYNPTTLASALQTRVNLIPGVAGVTVVADPVTGYFTANANVGNTFKFGPFTALPVANQLFYLMNWNYSVLEIPGGTPQTSGLPSMLSTQFIDIVCPQLTYNQDVKDGDTGTITRDILARIYLTPDVDATNPELIGSQPFQIYRQFAFPKQIKWSPNQPITAGLKFEVYDDQGILLTSGTPAIDNILPDWNMTLLVSEV